MVDRHSEIEAAILYGSRALGRYRPATDIDLILIDPPLTPPPWSVSMPILMTFCCPGLSISPVWPRFITMLSWPTSNVSA
ncbi:MAG: nucleotidyltransferase domain-containing protein [Cyanobacteriota bacterium]|nr:nucleotidyltransferase domain-containing protein [Cyanobacteriota bacterium]